MKIITPTHHQIAEGVGKSKPTIQRAVDILEARGKVKRDRYKARAIVPIR
jgi:DNA-binding GntR family transcriptional regulator